MSKFFGFISPCSILIDLLVRFIFLQIKLPTFSKKSEKQFQSFSRSSFLWPQLVESSIRLKNNQQIIPLEPVVPAMEEINQVVVQADMVQEQCILFPHMQSGNSCHCMQWQGYSDGIVLKQTPKSSTREVKCRIPRSKAIYCQVQSSQNQKTYSMKGKEDKTPDNNVWWLQHYRRFHLVAESIQQLMPCHLYL